MLAAEKKALIKFVSVFVGLNTLFLITLSILYFNYQKAQYLDFLQNEMINYTETATESIFDLDDLNRVDDFLLHDDRFDVELVDEKQKILFPLDDKFDFVFKKGFSMKDGNYYYLKPVELDHLKSVHYIVVRSDYIDEQLHKTREIINLFLVSSILFFSIVIFILSRLFLKPLREYIERLDRFIRDATHELNTPISVLSMSLERIDADELSAKNSKAFNRMIVATRTLSHLFDDLSYMMLPKKSSQISQIKLDTLITQRIAFFLPLAEAKQIHFEEKIEEVSLFMDENDIGRIVDNLISNAIKYNKTNGTIKIILTSQMLIIKDSGIGFDAKRSNEIFRRYTRLESASGGFGLGLNIVKSLCDFYNIKIIVRSKVQKGTTFTLSWKNSRIVHTS